MSMVLQNWKMLGRLYRKGCSANRHFCSRAVQTAKKYEAGQCIHGYRVEKVEPIPELYLTAVKLEHEGTAAQHIHIAREDRNNVFSVGLRTTPLDSTGVPHILEHTTLCGSEKFPCRDPFFKMLTRSLSTFMNAFTASDWTMYPFSTQNAQDFENLLSVYLDAVFYPQLRELDFMQEGWRLEHQVVNDHGSPIVFKGVVFNEMKGAFASPEQVYAQHLQNSLYPSHTYSHVSGGQPLSIPDLTWEKLRQFHAAHYHPSNARFYTYGNLPLERHLELIDSLVLSRFSRVNTDTSVPDQQRWSKPRTVTVNCAPDNMAPNPDRQTTVSVSYLLSGITDTFEDCTLSIIGSLLTSGPTSPFYQSLIEPGIGADFSPSTGYSGDLKEGAFSIGLQGIAEDDVPIVEDIIRETFDKVIEEGFPQERIDALLHNIELSLRHQTSNFGLGLAVSIAAVWNHDGSALDALKVTKNVEKFKQHVKEDPKFLQNKVKQYFKENKHKLNLIMVPKEKYKLEVEKKEDEKLQQMVSILTDDEKQKIYNKGLELAEKQNEPEDLSCLPTLRISDIEKRGEFIQVSHSTPLNVPVQLCEQPTNGVTYFKAVADASNLDTALLPYLPIFCNVLAQMGAGQMDFRELSQEIQLKTGGMSAASLVTNSHTDPLSYEQGILFSSYCLDRNTSDMFSIWSEIFNGVKLTAIDRLSTLVKMAANELAMSVAQSGHSYAMTHASSFLTPAAHMKERLGGISQVRHMKQIAEMQDVSPVLEKLALIAKQLLNKNSIRCSINASPEHAQKSVNHLETFLASLSGSSRGAGRILIQKSDFTATCEKTHVELPFPVNYVSKCLETVPYTHPDSAVLSVLATLLKWKYLHKEIREKGGAYGGGANMGGGLLTYYSYRDPHVMQTLEQFDKSADWAKSGQFSDSDVNEAKLFVFQGVDGPISPGEKGVDLFLQALTDEAKQVHREQFFDVQKNDIIQAAHRYLTPGNRPSSITFIGPENPATVTDSSWVRVSETESSDMPSQQGVV